MHIAICDDNVADRKQLERLLKKESEKRSSSTGVLYIDSFGNAQSLLATPMQYDTFYIDMCRTEGITGMDVVAGLTAQGVNTPIIMCCSQIDYRKQSMPSHVIFLDKPIKSTELSDSLDHALSIKAKAPALIELRTETETLYITEPDILYATERGNFVTISLMDGRKVSIYSTAANFYSQIENHPSFFAPPGKVINGRYVTQIGSRKVTMVDGTVFSIGSKLIGYAKYIYEEIHAVST